MIVFVSGQFVDEEIFDLRVSEQLEKEEMLQAFESDRTKRWKPKKELCKSAGLLRILGLAIDLERSVDFFSKRFDVT